MQAADNLHDMDFVLEGFLVEVPVAANQSLDCDPDVRPVVLVPDPANLKEQTEGLAFSNDGCKQCRTANQDAFLPAVFLQFQHSRASIKRLCKSPQIRPRRVLGPGCSRRDAPWM